MRVSECESENCLLQVHVLFANRFRGHRGVQRTAMDRPVCRLGAEANLAGN